MSCMPWSASDKAAYWETSQSITIMSNIDSPKRDIVHQQGVLLYFIVLLFHKFNKCVLSPNKFHHLTQYRASQNHNSNYYREQTGTIQLLRMLYKLQAHGQDVHICYLYTVVFMIWMILGCTKHRKGIYYVCIEAIGALFGVFLIQIQKRHSLCSLFPNIPGPVSRGKGHKSHPLRDYTRLKAYDPGWMESRAVEGGYRKDSSLPGMILADTLAPFCAPFSAQAGLLLGSCQFIWLLMANLKLYIKFKGRVIVYL